MILKAFHVLCIAMLLSKLSTFSTLSHGAQNLRRLGYKIRFAKPDDVKLMDACNRAVLPENYSADFYEKHMTYWPELTLIALTEDNKMIGYSMGRLEDISTSVLPALKYASQPEQCGHVASIAVLPQYRGKGVAHQMMNRLHHNMAQYYNMDSVNLFCRTSNTDALRLYQEKLNYRIERTVTSYYLDKEDGHFLFRRGLLQLWQDVQKSEPHLVGANELRYTTPFQGTTEKVNINSATSEDTKRWYLTGSKA